MAKPIGIKKQTMNETQKKKARTLAAMFGGLVVLVGLSAFVLNFKQEEISVVRLKNTLNGGDAITVADIVEYPMLKRTYDELGTVSYTNSDGTKTTEQVIIPWSARDQLVGMYMTNHLNAGNYLTKLDITNEVVVRNPWVAEIQDGQEIYTMPFDASSVNARLLYPGTYLRARITVSIANDKLEQIKEDIKEREDAVLASGKLVSDSIAADPNAGATSWTTGVEGDLGVNTSTSSDLTGKTPVAEIVIPKIRIADMRNSDGESIFDLYMSLLKMPVNERVEYLKTTISDAETAIDFQERVTPVDVTFIVGKDDATKLAEFEAMTNAKIKYTILPDMEDNSLMNQFVEISNQVTNSISGAQQGGAAE